MKSTEVLVEFYDLISGMGYFKDLIHLPPGECGCEVQNAKLKIDFYFGKTQTAFIVYKNRIELVNLSLFESCLSCIPYLSRDAAIKRVLENTRGEFHCNFRG
ncbi:Hypothetical predicted protein [Octopus vulgaris]|uniref:Uncharacterized protein n=1 Tax=Octopus vulgaris TaxID=6645 RepID=A0AA36AP95_OCTVU|nr:Hypothetical predicted protein [Octopus vulgaris]